ncbi:hypothetical protein AVI51_11005 [Piscirickettsia salmonis]|uniref:hypothetical protein n=1 Tax=Piscirickettsia salmonis TaxID=1238 RepID=UPI00050DC8E4|nr:hypothetical protein [Piscirickettsia salmonis]ALA26458.1 ABC-type transporter, periplasmic subunit family 3 [Piscirickettsia salmonis]APS43879.1 hypothetical protein AVI48_05495 [Piscirickettsia salmonis]APS47233.1 hypothetical protein AVI49_06095 [Piscirickettsia salmonis]APS51329.1 hypothetical protein AVI50_11120 [Piscirickettsia salmonis]APS54537.1 hypothetical protein AVI51_11005 [Piscirickettsia salmonis]
MNISTLSHLKIKPIKIIIKITTLIAINTNLVLAKAQLLNFTTGKFTPYSTGSTDRPEGPMHDVILATCTQMRKDCFFHFVPWNFSIMMTQNNRTTGFFPTVKNSSSENWLKFSKPIINSEFGFFTYKSKKNIDSTRNLQGFKLATHGPSELMRQLVQLSQDIPNSILYIDQDIENSFKRFSDSNKNNFKNYAVLADKITGEYLINSLKLKNVHYRLKVADIQYSVGFPKKSVKAATIAQFNASLATVLNDQTFTEQVEKKYGVLLASKK